MACDEAVLIAAGGNALVRVKARAGGRAVMSGTAVLHDDAEQWLAREVAVGGFLAERAGLIVPRRPPAPGAREQDRLSMTLSKFVPHDEQAPPPEPRALVVDCGRYTPRSPTPRVTSPR